jgi:Ca2+-binding RTX toxin-like protein
MATYIFEEMTDGDAEAFTSSDTLRFSSASTTPANVSVSNTGLGVTFLTAGSKTVAFEGLDLAGANIDFVSSFIAGTDATLELGDGTANSISIGNDSDGNYAYGFAGDDSVSGNSGDDYIFGAAGSDTLVASDGNDYVYGGADNDFIDGGSGADHLYGFALTGTLTLDGDDVINADEGNDYVQGNAGDDDLSGGNGNDRLNGGADNDEINGDGDNDTVNGNKGDDTIFGDSGNDSLRGGQDDDSISGGSGNDLIQGDLGNDTIDGGDGVDVLSGGDGDDVFVFGVGDAGLPETVDEDSDVFGLVDTITDFVGGEDTLDLPGVVVGMATVQIGAAAADVLKATAGITLSDLEAATVYAQQLLDNHAGGTDVAVLEVGSDTYLFYNGAGSATIDSIIKLVGVDADDVTNVEFGGVA